ncbi:KaiB [Trichodesmium erythraeum IMS101]|uniref:KaiB n=1 Tax=Trichodesmium erythraeum (strain IMS101) TaxID=203124 RepID=Q10VT5_TRIEI|nr:circadian clock KaiB family protein [Trichodesmium erythraeum GBRTRLIN201]MCH2049451.1 circadian clock KaiB family protein [Trichodesmium sp. ALOHA_ZT_67]MDE5094274.1 circadian clock KaiB family protein [Trichodesmium sp. St11_bin5]MDT9339930.1 circadian clock KaiB family protein [Trichodesmium erythraeum 21-75]
MKLTPLKFPQLFKGIALFTPGGDLIYCIDPSKKKRWHLHLCLELQAVLGLTEPPHFLIPGYTATIDKWLNPHTQEVQVFAEAYMPVLRYQALLNAIFYTGEMIWQCAPWSEEFCNPIVVSSYYDKFPQLWENHNFVICLERQDINLNSTSQVVSTSTIDSQSKFQGYVLHLFVSGKSFATEQTLQSLHQILEEYLSLPYTLKVIDVLQHPEQAEVELITATPTLIRVWPLPVRRIVGEFDNVEIILRLFESTNT